MDQMEKILLVPTIISATIFCVGGFVYANAWRLRLSRRAEMLAGLAFIVGGLSLLVGAVTGLVMRFLGL